MKKNTKRALLMSVLSLLACVSMLIGTTFAWFTDVVTSGSNIITSGNLDVDLVDENGDSLAGKVIKFVDQDDNSLWEPGCTYKMEPVYVKNNGNLALQYVVNVTGITGDAKLLEVIEWTITVGGVEYDLADLKGTLLAGQKSEAIILSGHMLESAGNEYMNLTVENISISVFATQVPAEYDSFDNQYDDIALVGNAADLKAALAEGGYVMLANDIALADDAKIVVPAGVEATLDLNGKTLSMINADADKNDDGKFTSADNTAIIQVKGDLTVKGEGNVVMNHTGANMEWNALVAGFSVEGGELTLNEGVIVKSTGNSDMMYAVDVNTTLGESILNVNGASLYSSYVGVRVFNNNKTAKGFVNYNSGTIVGVSRDIWTQIMSAPAENAVINTQIPYSTNNAGDRYYFEHAATYVANADGLKAALAGNKDIVLLADIAVDVTDTGFTVAKGASAKIDLNGNDIIATSTSTEGVQLFSVSGNLEIVGEGTISLNNDNFAWNTSYRYTTINIRETGVVTLGEGVNVICETGTDSYGMCYAVDIYTTGTLNVNGASLHSNYIAVRCFFGDSVVNVNSGSITSSKNNWGIWLQSAPGAQITIADGIDYDIASNGIYIFG